MRAWLCARDVIARRHRALALANPDWAGRSTAMQLTPLGDSAVVVTMADQVDELIVARVRALAAAIERRQLRGVTDVVPAFATVTVYYDWVPAGGFARVRADVAEICAETKGEPAPEPGRTIEIPVGYGVDFGPDLESVATQHGLTPAEVVRLHAGGSYLVHAIGFLPGFAYLGGLPPAIATPRRATPRREVPAGSVGIGGAQTGVYPLESPGGWNLIGRTALRLFDPARAQPSLFRAGDRVRFVELPAGQFSPTTGEQETPPPPLTADQRAIDVIEPGMFTTVQDLGRSGHRAEGVVLSGAADRFALRLANLLVGNAETAAGLECTLHGPTLAFECDTVVALGGAEFAGLPRWQPTLIPAGTTLRLGPALRGCRGYLAVAGGIAVPEVLGSRSTHVRSGLGGHAGRVLRAGDRLPVVSVRRSVAAHWHINERIVPPYSARPVIRVVRGAQAGEFAAGFFNVEFTVTPQADRMGVRLRGPALVRNAATELTSSAVVPGTIQVPPDGQPIVLLADAQTLGGYPQVAHVIAVDLPLVAQLRPGDVIRFREVSLAEAGEHARGREQALAMLREGLAQKLG